MAELNTHCRPADSSPLPTDAEGDRASNFTMVTSVTASNTSTNRTSAVKFWLSEEQAISPGHRELFLRRGNAANYEDYVTGLKLAIKQTVDSSRVARLSRKIKPIFILAHSIAPITTSASQLSPMPGSLILGGITCILSFATRVDDYQSRLVEMLEWMGDEIDLINQYRQDSLFDDNFEMEASENRIAADILKFCSRVAKMFYDADGKEKNGIIFALKAQCKDFDTKFGDLKTHFKLHVEDLKNHRDMAIARRLKAMGGGIESIESMLSQELDERRTVQKEKEERRRRFLNIIPSISFEDIQENNFDRRVPGTGDWLLRHPDFRAWRDCPSSTLLWVRGKPESGKSHLASRVIHELKSSDAEDEKSPTAYAYCTTTQSKTRMTFNNLLGSLLKQLYGYVPLAQGIESLLSKADVGVKDELQRTEMKEGIQLAASSLGSSFLIVDGLDECSHFPDKQFNELCSFLADLGTRQQAGVSIKVLILSRDDDPIIKSLSDATQIYLDKGANDGDIKSYISHRVDEINSEPSSDEQASFRGIKDLMFKHAGGIFLWVHFKANQFKEIGIVEDIMEALEDTTEGLDNLYGEEIQKVLGHSSKFVRERSLKSLLWVTNSYRPLTKPELLDALSTKPKRQQLNSCQRLSSHISLTAECFHLINEDGGYYRLRHASLKDFLLSELPILQAYATLQREAHSILSEVCLTYLNFETIKKTVATSPDELNDLRTNHPLLEYAAFFGPQHFKEARKTNARQLEGLMHQFLENEPAMRLCIQMLRSEDFERSFWSYGRPTPLHIMAIFNLRDIADAMSNSKDSLCCPDEFGIYPIEYSVFFSGEEMSTCLLNRYNELQLNHDTEYVSSMLNGCRLRLLHNSARRDWDDIVRSLISLGLRKDNRSAQHGRTPLHMAVLAGANRSLRCLLDLGASPDISAYNHETPLVMAARCRNSAAVHILLRCKVNVNHQGEHEETALHWAATQGLVEMASDLLDHGAKINARLSPQANFCGETPLHCAVRCGSIEMVQMLIDRGADINAQCSPQPNWARETPLHFAVRFESLEKLSFLVRRGADLEIRSLRGDTPALTACYLGQVDSLRALREGGANMLLFSSKTGWNGLHAAASYGFNDLVKYLLEIPGSQILVNSKDFEGETPLHRALRTNQSAIATLLLSHGARPDVSNNLGITPLQTAISSECIDIAKLLLKIYKVSPTQSSFHGTMPIHEVSRHGCLELLPMVSQTTKENLWDVRGFSPLHYAASCNRPEFIRELLAVLPTLSVCDRNNQGITAMHLAGMSGMLLAIKTFKEIDPSCCLLKDHKLKLALHHAAETGHSHCLDELSLPEIIDDVDYQGSTPLWLASKNGHRETVSSLIDKGANINKPDHAGVSPVLAALLNGNTHIVDFLLDHGADPRAADIDGPNLLHSAARIGDQELVRRLLLWDQDGQMLRPNKQSVFRNALLSGRPEVAQIFLQAKMSAVLVQQWQRRDFYAAALHTTPQVLREVASRFPEDVNFTDERGYNAMSYAASSGRSDIIKVLLEAGISIQGSIDSLHSPLGIAAASGFPLFVRKALDKGADVNDNRSISWRLWKRNPLCLAVKFRKPHAARLLLEKGADPTTRDWLGLSAVDYAADHFALSNIFSHWLVENSYSRVDKATRSQKARAAVVMLLRSRQELLDGRPRVPIEVYFNHLAEALLQSNSELGTFQARLCLIQVATLSKSNHRKICDICNQLCLAKSYHCTVCYDMDLCRTCYEDYSSSKPFGRIPTHAKALNQIEDDVFEVLGVLEVFKSRDVTDFTRCLKLIGKLADVWVSVRYAAYLSWAQRARSATDWGPKNVPGWALIKLIANIADRSWVDQSTGYLKADYRHGGLSYIGRVLSQIYEIFDPRQERRFLVCESHEYMEIVPIQALPKETQLEFNASGVLNRSFFQGLLDQYASSGLPSGATSSGGLPELPRSNLEGSEDSDVYDCLHPKSKIPGRNEDQLRQIGERLSRELWQLQRRHKSSAVSTEDDPDLDMETFQYELSWKLAHAMLGVRYSIPLIQLIARKEAHGGKQRW